MTIEIPSSPIQKARWAPHRPIYLIGDRVRLIHGGPLMVVCDFNRLRARCAFQMGGIDRLHWITREWLVPAIGPRSRQDEAYIQWLQAWGMSRHTPTTAIN